MKSYKSYTGNKTIYTSYFGYKNMPEEYQLISIANSTPLPIPTWNDVVPSWSIVEDYKKTSSYSKLYVDYIRQLHNSTCAEHILSYLKQFQSDTLVLMCWCKDYEKCHRSILIEYLNYYYDLNVTEYKGD